MSPPRDLLSDLPVLSSLIQQIDKYLGKTYPDFFGPKPTHPYLHLKRAKVVHDNVWGTNRYSWRELALIDSPVIQRLRDIHQVGLAFHVYPSARHTRFEHCLGVVTIASRVFDSILQRNQGDLENILKALEPKTSPMTAIARLRQELRMAALLHDTGHSLYSHTSELVYSRLDLLKSATREMKAITGKEKGAGEVLSFCIASTPSIANLIDRTKGRLIGEVSSDDYTGEVDITNVALMIVGRTRHPYLQFLADIVSSGFDADKLDYLSRDAKAAGLPLSYDIDRYLYAVHLEKDKLSDDENQLERFYAATSNTPAVRKAAGPGARYPYYETYRLRLPRKAINAVEQIIICKMMLFGYLYHHPKVRAAEGILQRLLSDLVTDWKSKGIADEEIVERFVNFTDSILSAPEISESKNPYTKNYAYRIRNRLLPREVYRFGGGTTSHAEGNLLADFLTDLQDQGMGETVLQSLEQGIGEELICLNAELGPDWKGALRKAGVWLDIPKPPKFEDIDVLLSSGEGIPDGVQVEQVFPITQWTQAYTAFRYYVRIFAFSEYLNLAESASKTAMQRIIGIKGERFYRETKRTRS